MERKRFVRVKLNASEHDGVTLRASRAPILYEALKPDNAEFGKIARCDRDAEGSVEAAAAEDCQLRLQMARCLCT
jgi:hypothetical protein